MGGWSGGKGGRLNVYAVLVTALGVMLAAVLAACAGVRTPTAEVVVPVTPEAEAAPVTPAAVQSTQPAAATPAAAVVTETRAGTKGGQFIEFYSPM